MSERFLVVLFFAAEPRHRPPLLGIGHHDEVLPLGKPRARHPPRQIEDAIDGGRIDRVGLEVTHDTALANQFSEFHPATPTLSAFCGTHRHVLAGYAGDRNQASPDSAKAKCRTSYTFPSHDLEHSDTVSRPSTKEHPR